MLISVFFEDGKQEGSESLESPELLAHDGQSTNGRTGIAGNEKDDKMEKERNRSKTEIVPAVSHEDFLSDLSKVHSGSSPIEASLELQTSSKLSVLRLPHLCSTRWSKCIEDSLP